MSATIEYWHDTPEHHEGGFYLLVTYSYTAACPGEREPGTGLALSPDDPESVEVTSITTEDGKTYEPERAVLDQIEVACWDDANQQLEAAEEARAEAVYERQQEDRYCRSYPVGTEHDPDPGAYWRG
jgi:hypothetical protein